MAARGVGRRRAEKAGKAVARSEVVADDDDGSSRAQLLPRTLAGSHLLYRHPVLPCCRCPAPPPPPTPPSSSPAAGTSPPRPSLELACTFATPTLD
ncbi:Os07g0137700 [Oryza sativa Japonica Group]|uniref:Os07g0137700 protein n=1 Tax=Oryza sativa subsp. japonica TaxID=39947 RepID=A0A0P0X2E3_ORYSJ|nr:Os07g0137700 [Oryza sativa Japonica Group]